MTKPQPPKIDTPRNPATGLPYTDNNGNNIDSVWQLEKFPITPNNYRGGRPITATPADFRAALTEYSTSTEILDNCLKRHKIEYDTFCGVLRLYPEISEAYSVARADKAAKYGQEAQELYQDTPPPDAYETDKNGCLRLSNAYITWLRDKHASRMRQAAIHESGTYVDTKRTESKNININRNANININMSNLEDISLSELMGAQRNSRSNK